jgi:hypothetical protein
MIISVFDYEKELEKNEAVEEMKKLNEDNWGGILCQNL